MTLPTGLSIPGDFPDVVACTLQEQMYRVLREYIDKAVGQLALDQERRLNDQLRTIAVGASFLGLKVIAVDAATVTVFTELGDVEVKYPVFDDFPPKMEKVPGLRLDLLRFAIVIEKHVNLTHPGEPFAKVVDIAEFTMELSLKYDNYRFVIGGGVDKTRNFEQYLVGVDLTDIGLRFRGYLAKGAAGGFIIWVHARLPIPIPLACTGFAAYGLGLEYGERFAPRLTSDVPKDPISDMQKATAQDYVAWARRNELTKWTPLSQDLRIYGITADIGDVPSGGKVIETHSAGIAYLSWGPTFVMEGYLKILGTEIATVTGAIDFASQSMFLQASSHVDVFKDILAFDGSVALSTSLKDDTRTWVAFGGFDMDGCAVSILKDLFVLRGGYRIIPTQGVAARGTARVEASVAICGLEGGYSFSVGVTGRIGWNPLELGGQLDLGGAAWIKIFGAKLGVGVSGSLALQLPKPMRLALAVEFTFDLPWPLSPIRIPCTIFDFREDQVNPPLAGLAIEEGEAIGFFHAPSGTNGALGTNRVDVWPDVSFEIPFRRNASGSTRIVNRALQDGAVTEAGISTSHVITVLKICRVNEHTGAEEEVPDVSAAWLGLRQGGGTARSSRLAIPSNDPLAWLQRFDYAQPGTAELSMQSWFQTFGAGPNQQIIAAPGSPAVFDAEEVRITDLAPLQILNLSWIAPYVRAVAAARPSISVSRQLPDGSLLRLPVQRYDIRLVSQQKPSQSFVGQPVKIAKVRDLGDAVEWSVIFHRSLADYWAPLELNFSEAVNYIVAVGFTLPTAEFSAGHQTVFQEGVYRLHVQGTSMARSGAATAQKDWPPVKREFRVVAPPRLRPYIRYATCGDERGFEAQYGGWNANPPGFGFGHYRSHQGIIRSRVGYLSQIFASLYIDRGDGTAEQNVPITQCTDGSIAGGVLASEWATISGTNARAEEECLFDLPDHPGSYVLKISRGVPSDAAERVQIDEWSYRVSEYQDAKAHLTPANLLKNAWGPFGCHDMGQAAAAPVPAGFDADTIPVATLQSGWALPAWLPTEPGLMHRDAGLVFLRLLHWAGLLVAPAQYPPCSPLRPATGPEIDILMDASSTPLCFILRTSEPVDWRRVDVLFTHSDTAAPGADRRFAARVIPSPDGCAACLVLEAEGVVVRAPRGHYSARLVFHHRRAGLPSLIEKTTPPTANQRILFAFEQPLGRNWNG